MCVCEKKKMQRKAQIILNKLSRLGFIKYSAWIYATGGILCVLTSLVCLFLESYTACLFWLIASFPMFLLYNFLIKTDKLQRCKDYEKTKIYEMY